MFVVMVEKDKSDCFKSLGHPNGMHRVTQRDVEKCLLQVLKWPMKPETRLKAHKMFTLFALKRTSHTLPNEHKLTVNQSTNRYNVDKLFIK